MLNTKLLLLSTVIVAAGCQKSTHASVRNPDIAEQQNAPPPRAEPVDIPGSLNTIRTYYQSRGVVSLNIKSSAVKIGDQFSLVNETTNATLIEHQDSALRLAGSYEVILRLYLTDPAYKDSFAPGENVLRLLVADGEDGTERTAKSAITLRDFPIFGFTTTTFDTREQRSNGLQGGFDSNANAILTSNGQGFLTTGVVSICNQ